ncbi:YidB family protein [Pararhizobium arenae]|uniref:YidB family protein n=1 Tax=Pararhizobium arenae TaxID=1856850 RepID=UPI00094B3C23|nr:YidB family protein [Pararhizobium arenae]
MPSSALKALLGVLAVAGYQNRDKIAEMIRGLRSAQDQPGSEHQGNSGPEQVLGGGLGGLSGLGGLFGSVTRGGVAGGLGDLLRQFEDRGQGETAQSWIRPGENKPIDEEKLSEVLGPALLDDLSARTGLDKNEILKRLSRDLPTAVDDLTPDGNIPADEDGELASLPSSVPSIKPRIV